MKKNNWILIYPLIIIGFIILLSSSCKKDDNNTPSSSTTVNDIDGNIYHTVIIGTQVWMVENLKTMRYNNGDSIPNVKDSLIWKDLKTGAFCDYKNNPSNGITYGRLYNWYTVNTGNLCPAGWHVPSDAEWSILTKYLGGEKAAGIKMKNTSGWDQLGNGNNESGFAGLPGGKRENLSFRDIGEFAGWWSSTNVSGYPYYRGIYTYPHDVDRFYYDSSFGFSVRCVKD